MAVSELARVARRPLVRGAAGILALYGALAVVVGQLTRSEPGVSGGRAAAPADFSDERLRSSSVPASPGEPAPSPPAFVPPEVLAAPAVIQQEPVVPLPHDPQDRAETLSEVRAQRMAEMLEQQARRGQRARALRR